MKEVMVAKLKKEDLARYKEIRQCEGEIEILIAERHAKVVTFWNELRITHNLATIKQHYIKGNAIYRQDI